MADPDPILDRNIERFIRAGAAPISDERVDRSCADFLRRLADAPENASRGRGGPLVAALTLAAGLLISLAVFWVVMRSAPPQQPLPPDAREARPQDPPADAAFPKRSWKPFRIEKGASVDAALAEFGKEFSLKIDIDPDDPDLKREAGATRLPFSCGSSSPEVVFTESGPGNRFEAGTNDPVHWALFQIVAEGLGATYVVQGEQIRVIRLTPKALFDRLDPAAPPTNFLSIASTLDSFEGENGKPEFWVTMSRFLQVQAGRGGASRKKWLDVLATTALDPSAALDQRQRALVGLRSFYGLSDAEQPDATAVLVTLAADQGAPALLRTIATLELVNCLEPIAREFLFRVLEGSDTALQKRLLLRMGANRCSYCAMMRMLEIPAEKARLSKALRGLQLSQDGELAERALYLRALTKDAGVYPKLCTEPADPQGVDEWNLFLEALLEAAQAGHREAFERLDPLKKHRDPRVRAGLGVIYGQHGLEAQRARAVRVELALLEDPKPIVRWTAAEALKSLYSPENEFPKDEWASSRKMIEKQLKVETDPRVQALLRAALKGGDDQ